MESQTIQELEALTPVEMDAGLVFSGVPIPETEKRTHSEHRST